jgi:phosphonoacetate hydrolase
MTLIGAQRIVIGMYDGLGMDYLDANWLPTFRLMSQRGFFKRVNAVFPTVTNANNVSICCGAWPKDHGITGNSYFNEQTGVADYMESAEFIRVPTIIQRAADRGVKSAAHRQSQNHSPARRRRGNRDRSGSAACGVG